MISILGFLIILAPLVIFHEFGHYLFAKLFNVKAEVFSVGFGPTIWKRPWGETEFRISAIPLGGYVKLLGEDTNAPLKPEEAKRALHKQAPWKRFFIFFGGPLFNFILAIFIYMAILVIGEPQIANVVGRVVAGSPAAQAGFRTGDRILKIDEHPVKTFSDIMLTINEHPDTQLRFLVQHPSSHQTTVMVVKTASEHGFSIYGEHKPVGKIDGLIPAGRGNLIGVSNPASAAARAGIKTRSELQKVNGRSVKSWEDFESLYASLPSGAVGLELKDPDGKPFNVILTKPNHAQSPAQDWGMHSSELFVDKTVPDSPAEKAGLQKGDRIIAVSGNPVASFYDMKDAIQASGEKTQTVLVQWEHQGHWVERTLVPTGTTERDPTLKKMIQYTIGIAPMLVHSDPVMLVERIWNPFRLATEATSRMLILSWRNLVSMAKMVKGEVSIGTLGGPILIGKIAGDSLMKGLIAFLSTMAVLSVGLGVLNILPIPVLDGGHILLLGLETLRGRPLSIRQMEIIQQVGLSLILLLMIVVMKNDISRLPIFN